MLRYVLIATAGILIAAISMLIYKYRKILGKKDMTLSKESVIGRLFLRKLKALRQEARGKDPREYFYKLNKLMRSLFGEMYDIKYEYAYVELNEELTKRGVEEEIRNDIISFTMGMSEAEYSGQEITAEKLSSLFDRSVEILQKVTGYSEEGAETGPAAKPAPKPQKPEQTMKEAAPVETAIPPEEKPEIIEIIREEPEAGEKPAKVPEEEAVPEKPGQAVTPALAETAARETGKEAPAGPGRPGENQPSEEPKAPQPAKTKPKPARKEPARTGREEKKEAEIIEKRIEVPKDEQERLQKLRKLLLYAESNVKEMRLDAALENYSALRNIYDSLSPEIKRNAYAETNRIIAIYNALLKEYSSVLTGKK